MKALMLLPVLALLAGCDSPEKRLKAAEDRLAMLERTGASQSELCREGETVYQAAVETKDDLTIKLARVERDSRCLNVQLEALGR